MDNRTLDFELAKSKHLLFKSRLRCILYDIPIEEGPVLSHLECSLGKWMYVHALQAYGHIPEMHELESVHADIHISAKKLVALHKTGKKKEAKMGLSEMEAIADKLIALLTLVQTKIDLIPIESPTQKELEVNIEEYTDLLRSNAELDKRIKQQIEENSKSLIRYEAILSALHEGIAIQDVNGVLQTANKSAEDLLGLSIDQMQGRTSADPKWGALYEDGRPMPGEEHAPMVALRTRQPQINQTMGIARPDGSIVWLQVNAQPLINKETGELTGVVSSFFDITITRKATADLKESEAHFRTMMDSLPQIAWTSNIQGEVNFYNQRWYEYTGLDFEETKSWGWKSVIHPDDLQYNLDTYQSILEGSIGGEFEIREKGIGGTYRWHLIRILPIKNDTGGVEFWIGTATDIHEIKHLQQQKDDFITIASHELKTPITSLRASLQLLNRMKGNPSAKMLPILIDQAYKSSEKVSTLIEDLLNVSKLNHGQLHLTKSIFSISKVIDECCQNIRLEGIYSIVVDGDAAVYADEERISQILINFVTNAIKYAPKSKVIKISIERNDGFVKISVTDTGPGIAQDKLVNLFDRYFRVDSTGIQNSGLGLGLYICAEIVDKHGGQIGVESTVGSGSSFWFTLPFQKIV